MNYINATNTPNPSGGTITVTVAVATDGKYDPQTTGNAHTHEIQVIDSDTAPDGPVIELVAATSDRF